MFSHYIVACDSVQRVQQKILLHEVIGYITNVGAMYVYIYLFKPRVCKKYHIKVYIVMIVRSNFYISYVVVQQHDTGFLRN